MRLRLRTVRGRPSQRSTSPAPNQRVATSRNIFEPRSRSSIISPSKSVTNTYPRIQHQTRNLPPRYPHRKLRKQHTTMGSRDNVIALHTNIPRDKGIISPLLLGVARDALRRRDAQAMLAAFTSPLCSVNNQSIGTRRYSAASTAKISQLLGTSSPVK